jgi:hypothetical protein
MTAGRERINHRLDRGRRSRSRCSRPRRRLRQADAALGRDVMPSTSNAAAIQGHLCGEDSSSKMRAFTDGAPPESS